MNNEKQSDSVALDYTQFNQIVIREIRNYMNQNDSNYRPRKYSRDNIRRYLENPETFERQIRETSQYLMGSSSHYFRIVKYFSKMLTLDYFLIPVNTDKEKINTEAFKRGYSKSIKYVENYNIKHEFSKILDVILSEDVFFGFEVSIGDSFGILRLPSNFCKITSIEDGTYIFKFNMDYFNDKRKIESFPKEFKDMLERSKVEQEKWQEVDGDKGICFKLREDLVFPLPPLSGVFEEVMDLEDVKELFKAKSKLENFKLLLQKIPFKKDPKNEKDFLISLESVKMFHNNIKSVLPDSVALISSPMDIEDFSFERKRDSVKENAMKSEEGVYNTAGISSGLFNSGNSNAISLNRGINVDESIMFGLLRQFERFFRKRLNKINTTQHQFKLMFPDLTIYNRKEKIDEYLKLAQYGLPKSFIAAGTGLSIVDLNALNLLENEYLQLLDNMIPLSSSHTNSGEQGRPEKNENELTDKGAKTKETDANKSRAK